MDSESVVGGTPLIDELALFHWIRLLISGRPPSTAGRGGAESLETEILISGAPGSMLSINFQWNRGANRSLIELTGRLRSDGTHEWPPGGENEFKWIQSRSLQCGDRIRSTYWTPDCSAAAAKEECGRERVACPVLRGVTCQVMMVQAEDY